MRQISAKQHRHKTESRQNGKIYRLKQISPGNLRVLSVLFKVTTITRFPNLKYFVPLNNGCNRKR